MTALVLAAALGLGAPVDADYRATLALLYDGSTKTAIARFDSLHAAHPEDPVGLYLGALALRRQVEENLASTAHDAELEARVEQTLSLADARLERDATDARALFARAGARGVLSRIAFLRGHRRESAREGARMREDLLRLRRVAPDNQDLLFGLGLYDYYVDVLPRMMKLLRLIAGLPGGDRERGLAELEAACHGALFHEVEARDQLYEILAYYEDQSDRALAQIRLLHQRYPGSPLWALKLADHLRERMGLYAEAAAVARGILASRQQGHPNFSSEVEAMARLSLASALLLDLRLPAARAALADAPPGLLAESGLTPRAHLLLARILELEGDRQGAVSQAEAAVGATDPQLRRAALEALAHPPAEERVRATPLLARARRAREAGRRDAALTAYREALGVWPACDEAALAVVEDELARGELGDARARLERLSRRDAPEPPWIEPWTRLLRARLHDLSGQRQAAVLEYKEVLREPLGQEALRELAAQGLARPYTAGSAGR